MADVAELGLKIDSSQAATAAKALDQLSASGKKAESAFAGIERAAAMGGTATKGYSEAVGRAYGITGQMSNSQVASIRNYETLIAKTQLLNEGRGREAAQLVALRKAGTTADTEYGKTVAALSGSLYDLEQQQNKTTGASGNFINTLTRRFVVGYIVTQIRQMIGAVADLNRELAKTGDVGRITGLGGQGIQGLQSAAAIKGVDSGKFLDDMIGFSREVDRAKSGIGELAALLNSKGLPSAKDTGDAFSKIADLVQRTKNDAEKFSILQQAGLPATREMVNLMEQGSEAIKRQVAEATKLTDEQLRGAKDIEERWNKMWDNFSKWGKKAVVDVGGELGILADRVQSRLFSLFSRNDSDAGKRLLAFGQGRRMSSGDAEDFYNRFGGTFRPQQSQAGSAGNDIDRVKELAKLAIESQRLSLLGDLATATERVRQTEIQLQTAFLNNAGVTEKQSAAIIKMTEARVEAERINLRAANGIVSADELMQQKKRELAIAVFNGTMTQEQSNRALENYARHARDAAEQAEVYASKLPGLKALEQQMGNLDKQTDRLGVGITNSITDSLTSMATGAQSAGEAFQNMARSIASSVARMVIEMNIALPIARALQSILGGGIGGLFGGGAPALGGGVWPAANGAVFSGAGIAAFSGQVVDRPTIFPMARGAGLMGEAGPEAVMPLMRAPDGKLGVRMSGGGSTITIAPQINVAASDGGGQMSAEQARAMNDRVVKTVRDVIHSELIQQRRHGGILN